jgi:hypothetical protein
VNAAFSAFALECLKIGVTYRVKQPQLVALDTEGLGRTFAVSVLR